ncbi:MAG: DUF1326 domain-containing protein, partial [Ardenticatenaceae bacterium]
GQVGGPIGIFMSTVTRGLTVHTGQLDFHYGGKHSYFHAPAAVQVEFEAIRNPVTGADHLPSALLPTGLLTKREEFFAAKAFVVQTESLSFSYPGRNGLAFTSTWRGP